MNKQVTIPTLSQVKVRDNAFCMHGGELKACHVWGHKATVRDLAGLGRSITVSASDVTFVSPDPDYAIGLVTTRDNGVDTWVGSSEYHLISGDANQIHEFFKQNSTNRGFTFQYAISTKKGVVVEITKKGKLTKKIIKTLLDLGFDQWFYSGCFSPKVFLLRGEVVPIAAEFSLVDGSDLNPWTRAMFGKEVPKDRDGWELIIYSQDIMSRIDTSKIIKK